MEHCSIDSKFHEKFNEKKICIFKTKPNQTPAWGCFCLGLTEIDIVSLPRIPRYCQLPILVLSFYLPSGLQTKIPGSLVWVPWFLLCPCCHPETWENEPGKGEQGTRQECSCWGRSRPLDHEVWIVGKFLKTIVVAGKNLSGRESSFVQQIPC